jgi:hypothetical protein
MPQCVDHILVIVLNDVLEVFNPFPIDIVPLLSKYICVSMLVFPIYVCVRMPIAWLWLYEK